MVMQCCRSCTIASSIIGLYMSLNKPVCLHLVLLQCWFVITGSFTPPTTHFMESLQTLQAHTHTHGLFLGLLSKWRRHMVKTSQQNVKQNNLNSISAESQTPGRAHTLLTFLAVVNQEHIPTSPHHLATNAV